MQLLLWMQYEDEDGDKVVLASDDDLAAAVDHARLAGWKARTRSAFSADASVGSLTTVCPEFCRA
jgi:hypothetical protein